MIAAERRADAQARGADAQAGAAARGHGVERQAAVPAQRADLAWLLPRKIRRRIVAAGGNPGDAAFDKYREAITKPGTRVTLADGTEYLVDEHGSYRRA